MLLNSSWRRWPVKNALGLWPCSLFVKKRDYQVLERRKDILTPNWAFLPDVIRRPKKELKRKLLSHCVIRCDVMSYPCSIEKSFSTPLAITGYPPGLSARHFREHRLGVFELGQNYWMNDQRWWTWGLVGYQGGWEAKQWAHFDNRKLPLCLIGTFWWALKGISLGCFVSLLTSGQLLLLCITHCPPRLVSTQSFQWLTSPSAQPGTWPPTSISTIHSSPSHDNFPGIFNHFHCLKVFSNLSISVPLHCNSHSSQDHYLPSGNLQVPLIILPPCLPSFLDPFSTYHPEWLF